MRNYSLRNTKLNCPGHELDYMASIIKRDDINIYLVGNENEINNYIKKCDKKPELVRKIKGIVLDVCNENIYEIKGIQIINDLDILDDKKSIVICTSWVRKQYESVRNLFLNYGYEENINFFQEEIFTKIYDVYVCDYIAIDRVEIFMTSYCTLNCKNCIAYIPYFKEKKHVPLDKLIEDADLLFSKVDRVNKYKLLGGEGLSYPYLMPYILYLCDNYKEQIGSIRIGTNGTIIPSLELLDLCAQNEIVLDISDYTNVLREKSRLLEIIELCKKNNVKYDIKRTGEQWLDLGFPYNSPALRNEQQLRNHFFMCSMFCRNFYDGKLFFCCSNFAAIMSGLYTENENDYFDFRKNFTKKQLLEYELGYSKLGYTTFCNYCRGCSDEVNPFHVEVARQLERKR